MMKRTNTMTGLLENQLVQKLVKGFSHSPRQVNAFLEGDAELILLDKQLVLAATTDGIVEEIEAHLYKDPYLIGWMTVITSLSDLAAVGAEPIGLLVQHCLPPAIPESFLHSLQAGLLDACDQCNTFVLGGDTNRSSSLQMASTGLGLIRNGPLILRKGCRPNDRLYASGPLGIGNAFAFAALFLKETSNPVSFKPLPRLREGKIIRKYGSCCMDTSDGLFPALANLQALNGVGFRIDVEWDEVVSSNLHPLATTGGFPFWFFLAGPHGEFELVFTIPSDREAEFLESAAGIGWLPLQLGEVIAEENCYYRKEQAYHPFSPTAVSNLFEESGGRADIYFNKLKQKQGL